MDFTQENVINKVVIPLLNDIGFIISGRAKQLCPVDTGRLRASIDHKIIPEELAVVVGTNVPYAKHVEFMYDVKSPHPGRETGQMPFLRPSIFMLKDEINRRVKKAFEGK